MRLWWLWKKKKKKKGVGLVKKGRRRRRKKEEEGYKGQGMDQVFFFFSFLKNVMDGDTQTIFISAIKVVGQLYRHSYWAGND